MTTPRSTAIVGAGSGNGLAFAQRFADAGDRVALLARDAQAVQSLAKQVRGKAIGLACDVTQPASVGKAFDALDAEQGPPDVVIYNAGAGSFGAFDDVTPDQFTAAWQTNALGLLHCAQRVAPGMRERGAGRLIVIGATASIRGGANFAAFASAKAAQRNLAQSLARDLWPDGLHVSLVIVDGVIDSDRTRQMLPDRADDQFMRAEDIAQTVHHLSLQPRSAWSFELDLRPSSETW